jgi:hypothetical protein
MDEITQLTTFRADTAPMTARAHFRGHQRLMDEIADQRAGRRGPRLRSGLRSGLRSRRTLIAAALTLAITGGVIGSQIAGPGATETSAQAISVLNQAADALSDAPTPRPDQFVYTDVLHTTGSALDTTVDQSWRSVDGSQAGLSKESGGYNQTSTIAPHAPMLPGAALLNDPYDALAQLPTDPDKLLQTLYADPWVHEQQVNNHVSRGVAVWFDIRVLMVTSPTPLQAALFRAAAKIPHITYTADATDALGRSGEAVGLYDSRVGTVQLILDRNTHKYLGERAIESGKVAISNAVRTVAFVDKAGQLP